LVCPPSSVSKGQAMKKSILDKEALQLAEKRKQIIDFCELAARDWPRLGIKQRKEILNVVEFDVRYLTSQDLNLLKQTFAEKGMLKETEFDQLVKKGYRVDGIPEPESGSEAIDQTNLDRLLKKAIPKEGFLKEYIDLFSETTDTPEAFLFWGAMTTLSTILSKNVWIPWEARKLYPNIWCVFLAPSGFRKGTGIDIPVLLLRKMDETGELLLPQVGSEEGLTKALDENQGQDAGLVRWQELSKILRSWSKKQSWQAPQEFWIDLYDNKPLKKKLSSGEFNIPTTSVSFLSASTPKSFANFFTPEDLDGGFFGRVYLINCLKKAKYFPIPPSIDKKGGLDELVNHLKEIKENFTGELSYLRFEEAFNYWAKEVQKEHELGFLDSFYSRIETHAMKLAMIYEAALTQKAEIREESFGYAVKAVEFLVASARPLVSEEIALSETEKKISQIAKYVQERTEVPRSEIMQNLHITAPEMNNIEQTLEERELIVVQEESSMRGPPKKVYTWSQNL